MYVKSTDGGAAWTQPIRLSHDPAGVVRDHITPVITIDANSRIHAFWLDRRLDPNNVYFDSWYSSSTDGGATWEADTRVSDVSQNINQNFPPGSGDAAGDYWGLDVYSNTVYVAWNDSRTGEQNIMVSQGIITGGGGGTPTPVPTATASPTDLPTATDTPGIPTVTASPTSTATATVTAVATGTATGTATGIATVTPAPSATPVSCPQVFTDVQTGSTFYSFVQTLACRAIISGYPCGGAGEPCDSEQRQYFRPQNEVTRGQLSKIVALSAGFSTVTGVQSFEDVPEGSTFHPYIEALYAHGAIDGYPCGGAGEPCGPGSLPYFRPGSAVTRGQTAKIVAIAGGYTGDPTGQTFEDVQPGSTFYVYVENLGALGVMQGYPCGGTGEPCGPGNLPYFRPGANITRAQSSKIVANTFFP
jgi:hypothetical protein